MYVGHAFCSRCLPAEMLQYKKEAMVHIAPQSEDGPENADFYCKGYFLQVKYFGCTAAAVEIPDSAERALIRVAASRATQLSPP